jgi:hypothetical protein
VKGREVLIVAGPNAIATGIHAGFRAADARRQDYWPLYIANIWFGTHRDGFSHLYQVIREERGYNYGDYSYVEHFEGRPFFMFPPPNAPRRFQYFSVWIRPVQHDYAHHIVKALTWELENFVRTGMTGEQCGDAKNKARVLYLSLAEPAAACWAPSSTTTSTGSTPATSTTTSPRRRRELRPDQHRHQEVPAGREPQVRHHHSQRRRAQAGRRHCCRRPGVGQVARRLPD